MPLRCRFLVRVEYRLEGAVKFLLLVLNVNGAPVLAHSVAHESLVLLFGGDSGFNIFEFFGMIDYWLERALFCVLLRLGLFYFIQLFNLIGRPLRKSIAVVLARHGFSLLY